MFHFSDMYIILQKPIGGVAVLPPINFAKEAKKETPTKGIPEEILEQTPTQLPPQKKKRKEKEPVALTADMTNGSSDVTPSKKKVVYLQISERMG